MSADPRPPADPRSPSAAKERREVYVSEAQRRSDLAQRILQCAFKVREYGEGSVVATESAIRHARQITVDASELLESLEARYEAIKDMPRGR